MKKSLTNMELSVFAGQLALILHSGISLLEGISILQEDMQKEGADVLSQLYDTLETTGSFTETLSASNLFPDYFIQMVQIGERSGTLEHVLESLSDYYAQQDTLIHSIQDALLYPLILFGMLTAVLAVLIQQVMPVFSDVFLQLGLSLSGMAQTVFSLSSLLQKLSAVFLLLFLVLVLAALFALHSPAMRTALSALACQLPFLRTIQQKTARSRFAHALALALHSGLDMEEGFLLASGFIQNQFSSEQLSNTREQLEQGAEFGSVLKESGIFSGLDASLISIGFRTGSAETTLTHIFHNSQQEAEEMIQKAVGIIEPTMTAILSILTGVILVSVMLPLLNVMSNIG